MKNPHRLTATVFLTASLLGSAQAAPQITVNGKLLANAAPLSRSGVTLVPLRSIFESLQCKVKFNAVTQQIEAEKAASPPIKIQLTLNRSEAVVSGKKITLAVPAQTVGGATYVPLRFVAESLGAKVKYDSKSGNIAVVSDSLMATEPPLNAAPAPIVPPTPGPTGPAGSVATVPLVPLKPYTITVPFEAPKDLARLTVGNQGGILKIWDRAKKNVDYFRGIDDRDIAKAAPAAHDDICVTLGIDPVATGSIAQTLMAHYSKLPKKESIALLGVLASSPRIDPNLRKNIQSFLTTQVSASDVVLRRQAVLALAVAGQPNDATISRIVTLYESSDNLWETFPVQQFFEYNALFIRQNPKFPQIRERISKVESLYTSYLLGYLDGAAAPTVGF